MEDAIGMHALTVKHHNWSKVFGSKISSLSDVKAIVMRVARDGQSQGIKVHKKQGHVDGLEDVRILRENGNKLWASIRLGDDNVLNVTNGGVN